MEATPADQQVPPPGETLKYHTWVLKVLIHCDGCTKRVKKILQGIEGVYTTEIDSREHKVTVTGNVEAETLIKKLSRSGKSVELWPQIEKPPADKKKKAKKPSKSMVENDENIIDNNKEKENQKKNSTEPDGDSGSGDQGCIDDVVGDGEDSDSDKEHGDNKCDGSSGGKKKKKKKKKNKGNGSAAAASNNEGVEKETTIDAHVLEKVATTTPKEIINIPPIQHVYPYPPQMYYSHPPQVPPPPPPYGLSYNTSYPVSSTSSYYVGAPVMPMHAYSRMPPPPPPSDPIKNYYAHHDDDNEGGYCSIM
ncbi:uncharacterized protein [Cicer arietinum]|uniref:Heavy metal-associated isoprenylated plant protein 36-like n=1 Tax=Cicer arietinum TaxID=3827 RepID=A0A1S2XUY7_CICAR|nr:heavy metal-associated isoprenylated plant protein 36-like [Cicer arietinum]